MVQLLVTSFILLLSLQAPAEILFESYAKLSNGESHTGYVIQRHEKEAKTGNLVITTFTRSQAGDITEHLKAISTKSLEPVSFAYSRTLQGETRTVLAQFAKNKMTAKITEDKRTFSTLIPIEKGVFLSSFLIYLMLQTPLADKPSEQGIAVGSKYTYSAVSEEEPEITSGEAVVEAQELYKGHTVFKIKHNFEKTQFVSYVTSQGQTLLIQAPAPGTTVEVVASRAEATRGLPVDEMQLKRIFGDLPKGEKNVISQVAPDAEKWKVLTQPAPPSKSPYKKNSRPALEGVHMKGKE